MLLQVSGQLADTLGEDGNLNLGGAGVLLVGAIRSMIEVFCSFSIIVVFPPF